MKKNSWVIVTNQKRYVGIPYMVRSGLQSFLHEELEASKIRTFKTEEEAEEQLAKYLSPESAFHVDRNTYKEGEELAGVEEVLI